MPARSDIINAVAASLAHVPGLAAVTKYRATPAATLPCLNIVSNEDERDEENRQFATYRHPMDPRGMDVTLELRVDGFDEEEAQNQADALLLEIERHTIGTGAGAAGLRALIAAGTALDYTWSGLAYDIDGEADREVLLATTVLSFSYLPPQLGEQLPDPPLDDWPGNVSP